MTKDAQGPGVNVDDDQFAADLERTIGLLERDDVLGFHAEIYRETGMTTASAWTDPATEQQGSDRAVAISLVAHAVRAMVEEVDDVDDDVARFLEAVYATIQLNPWEQQPMPDRAVDIGIEDGDGDE